MSLDPPRRRLRIVFQGPGVDVAHVPNLAWRAGHSPRRGAGAGLDVIGTEAFQAAFESARHSIFRLETQRHYAGDSNFERFQIGKAWQDTDSKRHWVDLVRRRLAESVVMQRVHAVTEPWSDYVRFEITWSYPPNVAAGEDIRIISGPEPWPGPDFWMFDDRDVRLMHYTGDGALERVEDVSASVATVAACLTRKEQVLRVAEPLLTVTRPR